MGVVALARHVSLDETVAIKFLRPELRRDPVAIARLSREARVLARIKSDHVARVLDVGVTLAAGPFMVMEYLEGTDLGEVLEAEGRLPVERAVEIVLQVCEALTVAHTAAITHRDIKPQNLFLARHGQFETLKILDFGIAADEPAAVMPPPQGHAPAPPLYGTPSYMSPERIRNDASTDHRADIWSVGVVLHELVTGRAVFDAPTLEETCARVLAGASPALEVDASVLPAALRGIIARCLEPAPERRYQSVEELAAALAPLGTMNERFRGRSTGAFSRKLVEEQVALSKTQRLQLPAPSGSPPTSGELSMVLGDIGAALRWVVRAIPLARVYDRPLWLYAAVALASALSVMLLASFLGDVRWVSPPPVAVRSEPLHPRERAARGVVDPAPVAAPPSSPSLAPTLAAAATENATGVAEPSRASEDAEARRGEHATAGAERVKPRREHRAATRGPRAGATLDRRAATRPARAAKRSSRVRLVEDKLITNSGSRQPAAGDAPAEKRRAAPRPEGERELPAWLELMRRARHEP